MNRGRQSSSERGELVRVHRSPRRASGEVLRQGGGRQEGRTVGRDADRRAAGDGRDLVLPRREAPATFAAVAELWLAHHEETRAISGSTRLTYTSHLHQHVLPAFGAMPLGEISTEAIERFLGALRQPGGSTRFTTRGLSDNTLSSIRHVLGLVLKFAARRQFVATNPMLTVEFRRASSRRVSPDLFSADELRRLFAAADALDPDLGTLVQLWARTGARAGEMYGVRRGDLDPKAGTVHIRRTRSGGGEGPTKTPASERVASYGFALIEDPDEWRPRQDVIDMMGRRLRQLRRAPLSDQTALFSDLRGRPWSTGTFNGLWRRVLAAARVRFRPAEQHRHTLASTLLSRGAPILAVQSQCGWSSAVVPLTYYSKWMPSHASIVPAQSPATQTQLRASRRPGTP